MTVAPAILDRMEVVMALMRLGGCATGRELAAVTSRRRVVRAAAKGEIVKVGRRFALPDDSLRMAQELVGVLSHASAARHWGLRLKHSPERPSVIVPRNRHVESERRLGVDVRWRDLRADEVTGGVTSPLRTVLDCARDLPFDEALAIADSALREGIVKAVDLERVQLAGPGSARARRVISAADGRADNPFESVLRAIAIDVPGLDVEPQITLDVGFVVRPDLVDRGLRLVLEADSFAHHGHRSALHADCRRYTALALHGWTLLRFSWEDVMLHPEYVRECLESIVCARKQAQLRRTG
jgi:very-short-patch-repair endonuclease